MTQQEQEGVSFFHEDLVAGGGAPIGNHVIQSAIFKPYDYNGTQRATLALELVLGDDGGQPHSQYYSVGPLERNSCSPDGLRLTTPPNKNSPFGVLVTEMSAAGMPESVMKSRMVTGFVGLYAYWDQKVIEYKGLARPDGSTARSVISIPTQIFRLPGQAAAAAAPPPPPPAGAVAPPPPPPQATATPTPPPPPAVATAVSAPPPPPQAAAVTPPPPPPQEAPAPQNNMTEYLAQLLTAINSASFAKQGLLQTAYQVFESDPDTMDIVGKYLYSPQCDQDLAAFNYVVNGLNVNYVAPAA